MHLKFASSNAARGFGKALFAKGVSMAACSPDTVLVGDVLEAKSDMLKTPVDWI